MNVVPLDTGDETLIWEFLCLAAHETDVGVVRAAPFLARYASGWGRRGDFGFQVRQNDLAVGVGWARLFPEDDKGFGWISATIPEISLAVRPEYRGRGVGRLLMKNLIENARGRFPVLSLNVRADNLPAVKLYQSSSFEQVAGSEIVNRAGGVSFSMRLDL